MTIHEVSSDVVLRYDVERVELVGRRFKMPFFDFAADSALPPNFSRFARGPAFPMLRKRRGHVGGRTAHILRVLFLFGRYDVRRPRGARL